VFTAGLPAGLMPAVAAAMTESTLVFMDRLQRRGVEATRSTAP
jgi:hypothetical protein